jgi:acyl transferase domain-containing protein
MMPHAESGHTGGVAITGMACLYPGAPDVDAYWRNILGKVDATSDPPPEAWDPDIYYDPEFEDTDSTYCKRGGYLGSLASFDPLAHGVPPVTVGGEPDQWLALRIAEAALSDAGANELPRHIRERTAVVLGKGTYLNGGNAICVQRGLVIGQTLELIRRLHPEYTDAQLQELREEMQRCLPSLGPETVPGLIPNIVVGRIANRLDFMGPTYTVDAACASSLLAVQLAVRDLLRGDCDLALAGGAQVWMPVPTLNLFCRLGALSRREQIRPFDRNADGTLLGEGIGMVVLKRLADAERDGDRVYAVVRGVGVASDGRAVGVMAPRVEGEELALRRAYAEAGLEPDSVGLIEAHGTGTPVGDAAEVQALGRVFGERNGEQPRRALGTVKSMISHTIPAAGVAGLIKASLALYHRVLPPTLNCEEPNPELGLERTPFYINT